MIDMMAEAANAQLRAEDLMGPGALRAIAPAKVNLFLGVGGRREDGLHETTSVMHALSLHDIVHVNASPLDAAEADEARAALEAGSGRFAFGGAQGNLLVQVDMADKVSGSMQENASLSVDAKDNLAFKAADFLARAAGREGAERILIRLEKHVPAQAGLGGGSADAAAVLACLARLWRVDSEEALTEVASRLGVDVPFFLRGGCALLDGAGERWVRALAPRNTPLCLMKPPAGVSTAAAYAAFDADPATPSEEMLRQVNRARTAEEIPFFNSLTKAADEVCPPLAAMREWAEERAGIGADRLHLSGSGSAVFVEMATFAEASALAAQALKAGYWARATTFSGLRAQVF